ncbi:ribulose-phosphate 3-epimerase [Lactobacillus sp. ESL0791]|uniref:ribulose-phosphate 3-epimerase n=1 Tax=Lactobacillus sp. ESL0791 TaxID=2983234 RepID=UPI0023F8BA50|nr:ribulose-phosphate 3-epimerase [Lactobacillus sp. ESL0791]MDF7638738.1 ribulose-phosphate 3-epimerase [Lactobacillus sp. ESL0791]
MIIAPSILNADNLNLQKDIKQAITAGISRFHIDIMDGHFVPNLSYGPELVSDFRQEFPASQLEIHLMSDKPDVLVPAFVKAGADMVELHYEAMDEDELNHWLDYLRQNQVNAGLVLNPDTPVTVLEKFMSKLDQVLLMTVYPGFGGQKFIPESRERIAQAVKLLKMADKKIPLEVDGGINGETAGLAKAAGAEIFVAGSYIFKNGNIAGQIKELEAILK